jgi:MFS family permease
MIWTLGEIVYAPVASAYVADIAPEQLRGRYQGAWGLTWGLAFVLAPALGAAIFAQSSDGLWLACGVLGLVAAALLFAGRASTSERAPEPPPGHLASARPSAIEPQSPDRG